MRLTHSPRSGYDPVVPGAQLEGERRGDLRRGAVQIVEKAGRSERAEEVSGIALTDQKVDEDYELSSSGQEHEDG